MAAAPASTQKDLFRCEGISGSGKGESTDTWVGTMTVKGTFIRTVTTITSGAIIGTTPATGIVVIAAAAAIGPAPFAIFVIE